MNPTNTVTESRLDNNSAFKSLVVAQNVDLVVTSADISMNPPSPFHTGSTTQIGVQVLNQGSETFTAANVRVYLGDPSQGGALVGSISYGDIGPGAAKTGSVGYTVTSAPGSYVLYAVANPDNTMNETNVRNNTARAPFVVSGGPNATFIATASTPRTVTEGASVQVDYDYSNTGDVPIDNLDIRFFDGDPAAGGKRVGDFFTPLPNTTPPGNYTRHVSYQVVTQGMSIGTHTIYSWADPDHLIAESNTADNIGTFIVEVRPRPDSSIALADLILSSATPEQGDKVSVTATVRDLSSPNDTFAVSPHVLLYLGDPKSGGRLLVDQIVSLGLYAGAAKTVTTTIDTTALPAGPQSVVCVIDPQHLVADANRTNNVAVAPFTIKPQTRPDLTVTRADLSVTPKIVSAESSASVQATVRNLRAVAASGVHVVFYDGDPATGGPPIGDVTVDVPASGQAQAQANLDTHGLLGDVPVFVRVDPNNLVDEVDKTNNDAALPIEVRHPAPTGPANLSATVNVSNVDLAWTGGTLDPQRGSLVFRDAALLNSSTADVARAATATANSSYASYRLPPNAIDGDPNTYWSAKDETSALSLALAHKEYVAQVKIAWGATDKWKLEAWDGAQFNVVATGAQPPYFSTTSIPVTPPVKTRILRITSNSDIAEVNVLAVNATAATTFEDANRPAGDYTYSVTSVDPDGIETMPASAPASIAFPDPPSGLLATANGNDITLTWNASAASNVAGYIARQAGKGLNATSDVTASGTLIASSSLPYNLPQAAHDNSLYSAWTPLGTDATPYLEAQFPSKQLVQRIDLGFPNTSSLTSGYVPRDFDIQTWDGSAYVTRLAVRDYANLTAGFSRFDLPDVYSTDRVRLQFIRSPNMSQLQIGEFDVYGAIPIPAATTSFVDSGRRTGSYGYTLTAVNVFNQESAPASASAIVSPPLAPTNLTATASGNNVALGWTSGPESNLAGAYVSRDGSLINAVSTTAIESRGTVTVSTDYTAGVRLNDGSTGTSAHVDATSGFTVDLVFPRAEWVKRIYYYINIPTYQVQTWDGAAYITQASVVNYRYLGNSASDDYTLATPLRTSRIRLVVPPQPGNLYLGEIFVYGVSPISGSTYVDANPPEATHSYQVADVSVLSDDGALSNVANVKTGTVERPMNLVASVSGSDVQLSWSQSPEPNVAGYHVYRDNQIISGNSLVAAGSPLFVDAQRPNGQYTYWVTAVDTAGGETSASNQVVVNLQNTTAPQPPPNLRVVQSGFNLQVAWDASASPGIVGYNLYKDMAAAPANGATLLSTTGLYYFDNYLRGQPRYGYQVTAVDFNGVESARTAAVIADVTAPSIPANVNAIVNGSTVTVNGDPSTGIPNIYGYRFAREGKLILNPNRYFGSPTASSTLADVGPDPFAVADPRDDTFWVSDEDSYPVVVTETSNAGSLPIDRVRILFPDVAHLAIDFDIDLLTWSGWTNFAQVRGNASREVILDGPTAPPFATSVRLTMLNGASNAVAVSDFLVLSGAENGYDNYVDTNVSPGSHVYASQADNRAGVFSGFSPSVVPSVPSLDLAIAPEDLIFPQTAAPGDTFTINATVHGSGAPDADTTLSLFANDPANGGTLIATQPIHVPAGLTAKVVVPYTLQPGVLNIYAVIDPNNQLTERRKDNNKTFRGFPPSGLPYRALAFVNRANLSSLFASTYTDGTQYSVYNNLGQVFFAKAANRGQVAEFDLLPQDTYWVSSNQKFSLVASDETQGFAGYYVFDQENRAYSTEFFFPVVDNQYGNQRIIVWARDPNTVVTVSNAQTGQLYGQASLNPGEHLNLSTITPVFQSAPIHVVANNPVAVVNWSDNGYSVPATSGQYAGTKFYAFAGNTGGGYDLNVLSYQDNTSYTIKDLDTGSVVQQGLLNRNGVYSMQGVSYGDHFYEVDTSNTAGVTVRPYLTASGADSGGVAPDHGGTLIGTDFLDTLEAGNADFPTRFIVALAYYDNTLISYNELAAVPDDPRRPPGSQLTTINSGDMVNFAPVSINDGNSSGIDDRARLYRIHSSRPIAVISGLADDGPSDNMAVAIPLIFGSANLPDVQVVSSDISLSPAQMSDGQPVAISAQIENIGAQGAYNFFVDVYDNAPEQGGRLLHEERIDQLIEGEPLIVHATWTAEPGLHNITVILDGQNQLVEKDKTNNRAYVLAQTKADLVIAAADLSLQPSSALPRQSAKLSVTVHDLGGRPASAPVALYLGDPAAGGKELARQNVSLVPAGTQQLTFTIDTTALGVGPQALYVKADPDNTVDEATKANNTASTTLQIVAPTLPDLAVTSVSANPSSASSTGDVTVTVGVDNFGTAVGGPVAVRLYDGAPESGGTSIATRSVAIAGPSSVTLTWSGTHASGAHMLVAVIDPDNTVAESDKTNNRGQASVQISAATTSLLVSTDKSSYAPGATATVSSTLVGTPSGSTLTVGIYDSVAALVATLISNQAATDGAATTPFVIQGLLPGTYQASGVLMQGGSVIARSSASFTVSGDSQLIAKLVTDHLSYAPDGTAQLIGTVSNSGTNDELDNLQLAYSVTDSSGGTIGQATALVAALPPGNRAQRVVPIALAGHAPTTATATLTVTQAGATLATATTTFAVSADARVVGQVSAAPTIVAPGRPVAISRTLTAQGNQDASGQIVTSVLDSMSGATLLSISEPATLPAGASLSGTASINTTGLAARPYIATVELISTAGTRLFRGVAGFEIAAPPSITIAGVNDNQCSSATITPTVSAIDQFSVNLTATLDGQPFTSGTPVTAEGSHTLTASATDAVGNSATRTVTFIVDETAPVIAVAGVSDQQVSAAPVTPAFSVTDANLTSSSATLDGAAFVSGTTVSADGVHILVLRATDCAGNQSSRSVTFTIDSTPPAIAITGVADQSCGGDVTPSFTVTDATQVQVSATLDGAPFVSGTPVTAEGSHVLAVSATDAAGNQSSTQRSFIVDNTPPVVTVSGVTDGEFSNAPVAPTVAISDANLTASSILLDGNSFASGTTVATDGAHVLVAQATDCAGHQTNVTVHFTLDQTPPSILVAGVDANACVGTAVTPTFSVTDDTSATVTATLDGAQFTSGTPVSVEGSHLLVVSAQDAAGNISTVQRSFIIDETPPVVSVSGVVAGEVTGQNVTPSVAISDANLVSSSVTLDGAPLTSGATVTAEGDHVLVATATDCAGHRAAVTMPFSIDRTPPAITITGVGQCSSNAVTPSITVTDAHPGSTTATLDGAPYTSGTSVSAEGSHTLLVSSTDAAGNQSNQTATFIVDRTPPSVTLGGVADGSYVNTDVFPTASITDANLTSSSLTLDGAPFTSGTRVSAEGAHTLTAQASDCAGNQSSAHLSFVIDRTAPSIAVAGVASGACVGTTVTPTFSATDASPVTVTATLDGVPFASGTAVATEGTHLLVVSAQDAAGNLSTVQRSFIIDETAPVVSVSGVIAGEVTRQNVTPSMAASDANLVSSTVTLDGAPFTSGATVSAEGDHVLVASATDCAGHTSTVTTPFAIDRTPPTVSITGVAQCSSAAVTPTVSVTDAHPGTTTITLDGAPYASGTPVSAEGSHTLSVSSTDAAGNQANQSATFIVDRTAPSIALGGVVDGSYVNMDVFPAVSFTDANLTTSTITLDGASFVSGTRVSAEGAHTLTAQASDCAGNQSNAHASFTIDKTPPAIAVSGIATGACVGATVTPGFTVTDASPVTVTATLDGVPFTSGSPVTQQGSHTLAVSATDAAGNHSIDTRTFIIDETAPSVSVTGVTIGAVTAQNVTPVVSISDTNLTSSSITLDGNPIASGTTVTAEGDHVLVATANDCAGHVTTVQVSFAIDRTPPTISVTGVSANQCTAATTVTPTISVTDAHPASQTITLDGAPFSSGTPVTASGSHVLLVSATDAAGNTSSQSISFIIDRQAPTIGIASVSDGLITRQNVAPTVTVTDPNLTSSSVQLDGAPFVAGTLVSAEGDHVLTVSASDCAGNQASAHIAFTIDKTPPLVTISGINAAACNGSGYTPTFSATDAHLATVSATLDGSPFASGTAVTSEGSHQLVVTATDAAGNSTTTQRGFVVDKTAPTVTVSGVSSGLITAQNVTPTVTISDANLTSSSLLLDGTPFTSGTTVTIEGDHLLVATATDCAGHTTTQQVSFSIDRTPPVVSITGVSSHQCTGNVITPTITVTDAHLASKTITLDGAPYVSGTPITTDGQHEIAVVATDAAGNQTSTAVDFVIDTKPPVITVAGVTDGSYVNTNVTPTFTITDANLTGQSALLDGTTFASGTVVSSEATHLLDVEATDCAGNRAVQKVTFTLDKAPPVVSLTGVNDGQCTAQNVTLTASYSDLHLATTSLTVDGAAFTSGGSVSAEGKHQAIASATDLATNKTTQQASFTIDRTPPTVTVSGLTDGQIGNTNVTPTVVISDTNLTSQSITLDGTPFTSGTAVSAEGDHVLIASATDCASQQTSVTKHFTIDKTPPVITVTGVVNGQTYPSAVTPAFSATDAHLKSVSATLDGAAFTSGTAVSASGTHVLVVTALDNAGNQAQVTVTFTIATVTSVNGTVAASRGTKPRVLIALECTGSSGGEGDDGDGDEVECEQEGGQDGENEGCHCTPKQPTFLISTLANAGYRMVIASGRSTWLNAVRSDAFGVVILYQPAASDSSALAELNEAVTYGNGLIVINGHEGEGSALAEALGAVSDDDIQSISTVQLTGVLGSNAVAAQGSAASLQLLGGTAAGQVGTGKNAATVAATHQLGLGHAMLLGWDTELKTSTALATLYLSAVQYVAPTANELVEGGAADVAINAASTGTGPGPFVINLGLDSKLSSIAVDPIFTIATPPTWKFSLPSGQSELFTDMVQLPDQVGSFNVSATLKADPSVGGNQLSTSTLTLSVPRTRGQVSSAAQNALNALLLSGSNKSHRNAAVTDLKSLPTPITPTTSQASQAVGIVLDAVSNTRSIVGPSTTSIRIDEARLLRSWQRRTQP